MAPARRWSPWAKPPGRTTAAYVSAGNGSAHNIAGVLRGSVFGLMPHPERATDALLGSAHGRLIFESIRQALAASQELTCAA